MAVVGLGLAGLAAGLAAAERGARTLVVGHGYGTTHLRSGTVDVLGYVGDVPVNAPRAAIADLVGAQPGHPYATLGDDLPPALALVAGAAAEAGVTLAGGLDANVLVATAAGTLRPTCLAPRSMVAEWGGAKVLAVGLGRYRDFDPDLFAATLPAAAVAHDLTVSAAAVRVEVPQLRRRHLDGMALSRLFEQASFRAQLVAELRPALGDATLVAFPAVLGMGRAAEVHADLVRALGRPVVELPTLPPSVPGVRLQRALEASLRGRGAAVQVGPAARVVRNRHRATVLELDAAARPLRIPLGSIVLATGGLASGGLRVEVDGRVVETVAGLPVSAPGDPGRRFGDAFLAAEGHAVQLAGVRVDDRRRVLDGDGAVACDNVFAAGGILAGARRPLERSSDGIACAGGYAAGREAADG